jgi:hypothetical protein
MRSAAALVLLAACVGGSARPGVTPNLTELPADPGRRDAILDSSTQRAGAEHRRTSTPKERKVETTAATAAAVLGWLLSDHQNTILGVAGAFDEGLLVDDGAPTRPASDAKAPPDAPPADSEALVPWVRLETPPPEAGSDAAPAPDAR